MDLSAEPDMIFSLSNWRHRTESVWPLSVFLHWPVFISQILRVLSLKTAVDKFQILQSWLNKTKTYHTPHLLKYRHWLASIWLCLCGLGKSSCRWRATTWDALRTDPILLLYCPPSLKITCWACRPNADTESFWNDRPDSDTAWGMTVP
jgi:hypothetical protein